MDLLPWKLPLCAKEDAEDGTWYVEDAQEHLVERGMEKPQAKRLAGIVNNVEGLVEDAKGAVDGWDYFLRRNPTPGVVDLPAVGHWLGRLRERLTAIPD